jgi:hypothetical protein
VRGGFIQVGGQGALEGRSGPLMDRRWRRIGEGGVPRRHSCRRPWVATASDGGGGASEGELQEGGWAQPTIIFFDAAGASRAALNGV